MLNAPSAKLRPNPLAKTAEEDEEQHREQIRFRDATNLRHRRQRKGKTTGHQEDKENFSVSEKEKEVTKSE